jgi:hypothetical protein
MPIEPKTLKQLGIKVHTNLAVLYEITSAQTYAIVDLAERFNAKSVRLYVGSAAHLPKHWISGSLTLQDDTLYDFGVDPEGSISS